MNSMHFIFSNNFYFRANSKKKPETYYKFSTILRFGTILSASFSVYCIVMHFFWYIKRILIRHHYANIQLILALCYTIERDCCPLVSIYTKFHVFKFEIKQMKFKHAIVVKRDEENVFTFLQLKTENYSSNETNIIG